jgi:hypothetical protein
MQREVENAPKTYFRRSAAIRKGLVPEDQKDADDDERGVPATSRDVGARGIRLPFLVRAARRSNMSRGQNRVHSRGQNERPEDGVYGLDDAAEQRDDVGALVVLRDVHDGLQYGDRKG